MRAEGGGAPPRATRTYPAVRYYGLRWRARDMARQARWWLGEGSAMWLRVVGVLELAFGLLLIMVTVVMPQMRQYPAPLCTVGGAACAIGIACCTDKRRRAP